MNSISTCGSGERHLPVISRLKIGWALAAVLGFAVFAPSCARVTVRKVPTPTQYVVNGVSSWTTKMQEDADKMEGVRFYLPRPFVNVFESFPVATDIYLAKGRISADGKYVAIDAVLPVTARGDFSGGATALSQTVVPQSMVFKASENPSADFKALADAVAAISKPRSGDDPDVATKLADAARAADDAKKSAVDAAGAAVEAKTAAAGAGSKPDTPVVTTGQNRRAVTNNNGAFAFTPLRGNFDLVYVPDFDEQYVVSSSSGLGNVEFQLNMGQGWSLQGFNSLSDNSELNKRIFSLIDTASQLATKVATASLASAFPAAGLGAVADNLAKPRAGADAKEAAGTEVALKVVVVHYAAKGLYPIVKPRELYDRVVPRYTLNMQQAGAGFQLPTANEIQALANAADNYERRSTVPIYPYQYISFSTFRYMAIQVLKTDGLPFGTLYDKTGTVGDPGDREASSTIDQLKRLFDVLAAGGGGSQGSKPDDTVQAALTALQDKAAKVVNEQMGSERVTKVELTQSSTDASSFVVVGKLFPVAGGKFTQAELDAAKPVLEGLIKEDSQLKAKIGAKKFSVRMDQGSAPANPATQVDTAKITQALNDLAKDTALKAANEAVKPKTLQSVALVRGTAAGAELTITATPTLGAGIESLTSDEEGKLKAAIAKVINDSKDAELTKLRAGKEFTVTLAASVRPQAVTGASSPDAEKQKKALADFAAQNLPAMKSAVGAKSIQGVEMQAVGSSPQQVFILAVVTLGAGTDALTDGEVKKLTDLIGPALVVSTDAEIKNLLGGRSVTVHVATKKSS